MKKVICAALLIVFTLTACKFTSDGSQISTPGTDTDTPIETELKAAEQPHQDNSNKVADKGEAQGADGFDPTSFYQVREIPFPISDNNLNIENRLEIYAFNGDKILCDAAPYCNPVQDRNCKLQNPGQSLGIYHLSLEGNLDPVKSPLTTAKISTTPVYKIRDMVEVGGQIFYSYDTKDQPDFKADLSTSTITPGADLNKTAAFADTLITFPQSQIYSRNNQEVIASYPDNGFSEYLLPRLIVQGQNLYALYEYFDPYPNTIDSEDPIQYQAGLICLTAKTPEVLWQSKFNKMTLHTEPNPHPTDLLGQPLATASPTKPTKPLSTASPTAKAPAKTKITPKTDRLIETDRLTEQEQGASELEMLNIADVALANGQTLVFETLIYDNQQPRVNKRILNVLRDGQLQRFAKQAENEFANPGLRTKAFAITGGILQLYKTGSNLNSQSNTNGIVSSRNQQTGYLARFFNYRTQSFYPVQNYQYDIIRPVNIGANSILGLVKIGEAKYEVQIHKFDGQGTLKQVLTLAELPASKLFQYNFYPNTANPKQVLASFTANNVTRLYLIEMKD